MSTATHPTRANKRKNGSSSMGHFIDRAEALVAATADLGEDKLDDIRGSLQKDLEAARAHLEKLEAGIKGQATTVDDYVHKNAWQSVGVAAGAGVLTGYLLRALTFRR